MGASFFLVDQALDPFGQCHLIPLHFHELLGKHTAILELELVEHIGVGEGLELVDADIQQRELTDHPLFMRGVMGNLSEIHIGRFKSGFGTPGDVTSVVRMVGRAVLVLNKVALFFRILVDREIPAAVLTVLGLVHLPCLECLGTDEVIHGLAHVISPSNRNRLHHGRLHRARPPVPGSHASPELSGIAAAAG